MKPDKDCRYCDGTGVRYVPNGPDDFEKEVCECTEQADISQRDSCFDSVVKTMGEINKAIYGINPYV